jgi:hypothetical protein
MSSPVGGARGVGDGRSRYVKVVPQLASMVPPMGMVTANPAAKPIDRN